jgi:hypothetical protein
MRLDTRYALCFIRTVLVFMLCLKDSVFTLLYEVDLYLSMSTTVILNLVKFHVLIQGTAFYLQNLMYDPSTFRRSQL